MIKIYLYLIDILVPLFFGLITILINTSQYSISYDIQLYFLFSISIFFLSVLKNYYKDYYLINFSEKLRIAFITWVFAVFIQMIAYNYLLIKVEPLTMIFWVLIPITSLFIKFILKIKTKNIMKSNIHIIGKFYTFNDYEIKTLTDKGYLK
jgi:hypothetical protein